MTRSSEFAVRTIHQPFSKQYFCRSAELRFFIAWLIVLSAIITVSRGVSFAQPPGAPALVEVSAVVEREIAAGQTFVGTVEPARTSVVGSAVDGRVLEFLVNEGDLVGVPQGDGEAEEVGQPLVQLRTKTISIQVEAARAELELRKQELAELENGTRPEEIAQAKARLAETIALLNFAKSRFARIERLYRQNALTQEDLDQARSTMLAAEQANLAAKAAYDLAIAGPRKEQIGQARARYAAQQEEVNRLEDRKAKYTIRAPFVGYVVAKHAEVGQWVSQGDPIVEVVELDPVEINVAVPAEYIGNLRSKMAGKVRISGLANELITGEIWRIVPQADLRSRTFPVKIRLPNPRTTAGNLIKAGMLAHVTLPVGRKTSALLAPKDALVLEGGTTSVFLVNNDLTIKKVGVDTGIATGPLIQLIDATRSIKAGQQIVVRGNERLRPGMTVKAIRNSTSSN